MIVIVYSFSLISFIQTFNELGNLTLQRLAFFLLNGLREDWHWNSLSYFFIFVQFKANLTESSFNVTSIK